MVRSWSMPIDFAVENQFLMWEFGNGVSECGDRLRQTIAREHFDSRTLLVSEQADAIELAFKDPFRTVETLLGERGSHRLNPLGKARHAGIIAARSRLDRGQFALRTMRLGQVRQLDPVS